MTQILTVAWVLSRYSFSYPTLCRTQWTTSLQGPLSMGFSRQEHWSGLLCPPPGALPYLKSLALAGGFFTTSTACVWYVSFSVCVLRGWGREALLFPCGALAFTKSLPEHLRTRPPGTQSEGPQLVDGKLPIGRSSSAGNGIMRGCGMCVREPVSHRPEVTF